MNREVSKIGRRGTLVIPARMRRQLGLEEGSLVIAECERDAIVLRPAVAVPIERYSTRRRAEFILTNATNAADYQRARREVRKLGLDPDEIPHRKVGR